MLLTSCGATGEREKGIEKCKIISSGLWSPVRHCWGGWSDKKIGHSLSGVLIWRSDGRIRRLHPKCIRGDTLRRTVFQDDRALLRWPYTIELQFGSWTSIARVWKPKFGSESRRRWSDGVMDARRLNTSIGWKANNGADRNTEFSRISQLYPDHIGCRLRCSDVLSAIHSDAHLDAQWTLPIQKLISKVLSHRRLTTAMLRLTLVATAI